MGELTGGRGPAEKLKGGAPPATLRNAKALTGALERAGLAVLQDWGHTAPERPEGRKALKPQLPATHPANAQCIDRRSDCYR